MPYNYNRNVGKPVLVTLRKNATVDSYRRGIGEEAQRRRGRHFCNSFQKVFLPKSCHRGNVLFYVTCGLLLTGFIVCTVNEIQNNAPSSSSSPDAPDSDLLPYEHGVCSKSTSIRSGSITNNTSAPPRFFHSHRPHTPSDDSTLLFKREALLVRASDGSEHLLFTDDSSGHSSDIDDSSIPSIRSVPDDPKSYRHFYIRYLGINLGIKASSYDMWEMWWHTHLTTKERHFSPHLQRSALIRRHGYEGYVSHVVASALEFSRAWDPAWLSLDTQRQNSKMVLQCAEISLYWMTQVQEFSIFILTAKDILKMKEIYESLLNARLPKTSEHFHVNSEMHSSLMRVFIDACDGTLSTINKEPTRFDHQKENKAILDEFVKQLASSIREFKKMTLDYESRAKEEEHHSARFKP